MEIVQSREFLGDAVFGTATTQLHKVTVTDRARIVAGHWQNFIVLL